MIQVRKTLNNTIQLHAEPDLVMYADYAEIDALIEQLQAMKPAITDAQAQAALMA